MLCPWRERMAEDWKKYQENAAAFFQSLGLDADVEARVEGVRGVHDIDVFVQGNFHGIDFRWVVECKAWKCNVPKEKAIALMAIVQDVGADRGFLLSETGFQSGTIRAVTGSNITLTSLEDLRDAIKADLVEATLAKLSWRANRAREKLWRLHKATDEYYSHFVKPLGALQILPLVFEDALHGKYPNIYKVEHKGEEVIRYEAASFEELVERVNEIICEAEAYAELHSK